MTVPEQCCPHCGSAMRKSSTYLYCPNPDCGHRKWDDPKILCLCKRCYSKGTEKQQSQPGTNSI